jgi:ubiquinone/menaquinone biosynthesis C-methylase UbiE
MQSLSVLKKILTKPFASKHKQTNPEEAYDLWSCGYDSQPDNLMLALDEEIFSDLIKDVWMKEKILVDIGCGTGRHWNKIIDKEPKNLTGYDVSEGMLAVLHKKIPEATTYKLKGNFLSESTTGSCDVIISTLAIAHIENIEEAFNEWDRVLKPGGEIIITDYHPAALSKGGNRTFKHAGELIAVKNHIHSVSTVRKTAAQLHWQVIRFIEKKIDPSMIPYYKKQNALAVFEQFQGVPIIYGMHLKKSNAAL